MPALWRRVDLVHEDKMRVWQAGVEYKTGDKAAYPDAAGGVYACLQGHTAQADWEPPAVPALWAAEKNHRGSESIELAIDS